ncbi:MAG: DNA methyltransferase [Candidatus Bathyarchaeota archaeon]|nr:DNA methyltransferase [Candidatus Bathyarchaeota archaeon]
MKTEERYDLGQLVTFKPSKRLPVYNWFHFREAFSRDFVALILSCFHLHEDNWILDPFCGSGTTLLAARERGINAVGVDAHPVFAFVSQVKTQSYSLELLRELKRDFFAKKFAKPNSKGINPLLKKAFSKYALEDILFFESEIKRMEDAIMRNLMVLALVVSAMKVSFAVKDGAVLRFRKREHPPLRKVFKATVKKFARDLKKTELKSCEITVKQDDARNLDFLAPESFDAVITSPPYLNKLEYVKAFDVEKALLAELISMNSTTTYLGIDLESSDAVFPDLKLPPVARAYFSDMELCLGEMYRVLRKGGKAALVVGQGVFPDGIVESDVLVSKLARSVGFNVSKRLIVNKRVATKQRTVKIGEALESILLLTK